MIDGQDLIRIHVLREITGLTEIEVSDEELLSGTEGTFFRAKLELCLAILDLRAELAKVVIDVISSYNRRN
jgi:hypothetical protein